MDQVTEMPRVADEGRQENGYEPVYTLRDLNALDTFKIYRLVRNVSGEERIRQAVSEGGMQGGQYAAAQVLFEQLEGELLPLMISMVRGEESRFKLPRKLPAEWIEEGEEEKDAHRRLVAERVEEWLESQPMSAPIDLFNDVINDEGFLSVFASASRAGGGLKRIFGLLGIDWSRLVSSGEEIGSSSSSPSGESSESSSG
jgi:hypothetical protein